MVYFPVNIYIMYDEHKPFKIAPNDTKVTFARVLLKSGEEAIVAFADSAAATYGYMNLPSFQNITEKQALSNNEDIYFWEAGIYTLDQLHKNKKYISKKKKEETKTKKKTIKVEEKQKKTKEKPKKTKKNDVKVEEKPKKTSKNKSDTKSNNRRK